MNVCMYCVRILDGLDGVNKIFDCLNRLVNYNLKFDLFVKVSCI